MADRAKKIFIIAGEPSGDQLGADLMRPLRNYVPNSQFIGVGGDKMIGEGLQSLFPLSDIAVMGIGDVLSRLCLLRNRIKRCVDAVIEFRPDVLVLIDSPDFNHRVAKRVRRQFKSLPIIKYVAPSVWAWRPGRARKMKVYINHVMALLPFEADALRRLDGPKCSYVGHPLIEKIDLMRPNATADSRAKPVLLLLPGSRTTVIRRSLQLYRQVIVELRRLVEFEIVIVTLPDLVDQIIELTRHWPVATKIVSDEEEKLRHLRQARLALANSGTVTLELALAGIPMIATYKTDMVIKLLEPVLRRMIKVSSILLPNIIIGRDFIPEFVNDAAEPRTIASALARLISDSEERSEQLAAFVEVEKALLINFNNTVQSEDSAYNEVKDHGKAKPLPQINGKPGDNAARIVASYLNQ